MKRILLLSVTLLAQGCCAKTSNSLPAKLLTPDQISDTRDAVRGLLEGDERVVAICGESGGRGLYVDQFDEGWIEDGITNGRTILVAGAGNTGNVIFRDASATYTSARQDGGVIFQVQNDGNGPLRSWVVIYPSTGVTETHVVSRTSDGKLVDLWTSNKPQVIISANVKAFQSYCAIP